MTIHRQVGHEAVLGVIAEEAEESVVDGAHVVGSVEHARRGVERDLVRQVNVELDVNTLLEHEIRRGGVEKVQLVVRGKRREYGNRGNPTEEEAVEHGEENRGKRSFVTREENLGEKTDLGDQNGVVPLRIFR